MDVSLQCLPSVAHPGLFGPQLKQFVCQISIKHYLSTRPSVRPSIHQSAPPFTHFNTDLAIQVASWQASYPIMCIIIFRRGDFSIITLISITVQYCLVNNLYYAFCQSNMNLYRPTKWLGIYKSGIIALYASPKEGLMIS